MEERKCGNCLYFEQNPSLAGQGECQRYPRVFNSDSLDWEYPNMNKYDRCGEWFPKDAQTTGRVCSICQENPCACGEPVTVIDLGKEQF